jgi:hypothetical protein
MGRDMRNQRSRRKRDGRQNPGCHVAVCGAALLGGMIASVQAQDMIGLGDFYSPPDIAEYGYVEAPEGGVPRAPLSPEMAPPPLAQPQPVRPYLYNWRGVQIRPDLRYQFLYGNGILRRPGNPITTGAHTLTPGLRLNLGNYVGLYYIPQLTYYTTDLLEDQVSHSAGMQTGAALNRWRLGLSQRYLQTSSPLIETGEQVSRTSYQTGVSAAHPLSSAMSVQLSAAQNFTFSDRFNNWRQWSTLNWLNWQARPKVGLGLGAGFGYTDVDFGTDMTFENILGRVQWFPGDRLSVQANGGVEIRQFLQTDVPDQVSPVYGFGLGYQMFDHTSVSLDARRATGVSILRGQIHETTMVTLGIRQQLMERFAFSLRAGYRETEFQSTGGTELRRTRRDEYVQVRPALSYNFMNRTQLSTFYQFNKNLSRDPRFEFDGHLVGFEARYGF